MYNSEVDPPPVARNDTRAGNNNKSAPPGSRSATASEGSLNRGNNPFGTNAGKMISFAGPSHVLFSAFASASGALQARTRENRQRCLRIDPRLERDYIHKRKRAHETVEWSSTSSPTTNVVADPWEGVSKVERELVDCCESLKDDFYSRDNDQETEDDDDDETDTGGPSSHESASSDVTLPSSSPTNPISGVLAVEKEVRFAAILSRGCNTMASRCLAIAILERTLEEYLAEEATSALLLQQVKQKGKDDEKDSSDRKNDNNDDDNTREKVERARSLADKDATIKVNDSELDVSSSPSSASDNTTSTIAQQRKRRFRLFFAAGGLRILNQWLVDATSYDTTTTTTTISSTASHSSTPKSISSIRGKNDYSKNFNPATKLILKKPHTTRPIALSILLFLEHIPFEKKTVTNSKINKQVQKLGKKVASIKEAHENGQAPEEDLDNWTTPKPIAHDEALTRILVAVDSVKASWREKAKIKGEKKQPSPFVTLQLKIKERLQVLTKFESEALSTKPEWYRPAVTVAAFKSNSSPLKRKAMSDAEIEKLNLQKKIKQVQSRSQKSLKQLREKLRRRKVEHNHTHSAAARNPISSFSNNKKVVWKDGLKSQVTRNRQMLEDVFVFEKDMPPSASGQEDNLPLSNQLTPTTSRGGGLG